MDKSLSFGLQNFVFVNMDESDQVYDFIQYVTRRGTILIARYNKAGTEARYCMLGGNIDTVWAARTTLTYVYPTLCKDLNL